MACNLNRSPKVNNVEKCGGLPEEIHNAACHMLEGGGVKGVDAAIAAAVNFVKTVCATGQSKNFRKSNPEHHVAAPKVARACANVAKWKALNACQRSVGTKGMLPPMQDTKAQFGLNTPGHVKAMEDGKLRIRGLASDAGLDRDNEAFLPGAFDRGMKAYMASNPVLLYHHMPDKPLGRVVDYEYDEQGSLIVEAEIDPPAEGAADWHVEAYNSIKNHATKGYSVGGYSTDPVTGLRVGGGFKRTLTADGPRIYEADVQEISVTPLPVNPRSFFDVLPEGATKAVEVIDANIWPEDEEFASQIAAVKALTDIFDKLEAAADKISGSGSTNGI